MCILYNTVWSKLIFDYLKLPLSQFLQNVHCNEHTPFVTWTRHSTNKSPNTRNIWQPFHPLVTGYFRFHRDMTSKFSSELTVHTTHCTTDIEGRSQTSYTAIKHKQNAPMIFMHACASLACHVAFFYACLFSLWPHQMQVTYPHEESWLFWSQKKPNTWIGAPCW